MKRKSVDLEFLKGNLKNIETYLIDLEKEYIKSRTIITEIHSYLKEISNIPLQEYRKIQIRTFRNYIKKIEERHLLNTKQIEKSYELIQKILNVSLLDEFSKSVENHIIQKLKKDYKISLKNIKNQKLYFLFKLKDTIYCVLGELIKILKFDNKKNLEQFIEEHLKESIIFPNYHSLDYFFPLKAKTFYLGEFQMNSKKIYIIFYNKILCKRRIEDIKFIKNKTNSLIPYYFYYKGRRVYVLQI